MIDVALPGVEIYISFLWFSLFFRHNKEIVDTILKEWNDDIENV